MEDGKISFKALTRFSAGMGDLVVNVATWARAWTPASVRPEPCGKTFSPVTRPIAEASVPWMVAASGCTCHPENSEPSYARTSLRLRMRIAWSFPQLHTETLAKLCKFDAVSWSTPRVPGVASAILLHSTWWSTTKRTTLPGLDKNETRAGCFA